MEHTDVQQLRKQLLTAPSGIPDCCLTLPSLPALKSEVCFLDEEVHSSAIFQNGCSLPMSVSDVYLSTVKLACKLSSGDDVKKVLSLSLQVKDSEKFCVPGDCIGILPCNSDPEVEKFAECLKVKDVLFKKCLITIEDIDSKKKRSFPNYIPLDSSVYNILKTCVDLRAVPKKVLLRLFSEYCSESHEKRLLQEFSSKEGSSLYNCRILEPGTSILDTLRAFSSCCPPIEKVLELMPRLLPRPYSIASSPLVTPNEIQIILTVVEEPRKGVCSGWLYELTKPLMEVPKSSIEQEISELTLQGRKHNIQVPIFFRKSNGFNLPEDPSVPLILIGPGTGIAPFIGFLLQRAAEKRLSPDVHFGDILLFYGCRYECRDYLFRKELEQFSKDGVVSELFVSFSREHGIDNKKYVQDNIRKYAKKFLRLFLEERGIVYVCGDGRTMAKDVWNTISEVISSEKDISIADASLHLSSLQKYGCYRQDIWL